MLACAFQHAGIIKDLLKTKADLDVTSDSEHKKSGCKNCDLDP